jgi:hypothetical protein
MVRKKATPETAIESITVTDSVQIEPISVEAQYNYPITDLRFHKKQNGAKILQGLYNDQWIDIPIVED